MSRKRAYGGGCKMVLAQQHDAAAAWRDEAQQRDQAKRSCGSTAGHAGVGELDEAAVSAFIHSISRHVHVPHSEEQLLASTGLDRSAWRAMAELNALMTHHHAAITSDLLVGLSCFTTQPREKVWQRYAESQGLPRALAAAPAQELVAHPQQQLMGRHLRSVRFLLERVLAPHPDACISRVRLRLPAWGVAWACRWGWAGAASELEVCVVAAYASIDPSSSSASAAPRQPACRIFLPVLPE